MQKYLSALIFHFEQDRSLSRPRRLRFMEKGSAQRELQWISIPMDIDRVVKECEILFPGYIQIIFCFQYIPADQS